MQVKYHKIYSHYLQEDFEFKTFGHAGKPVMVFPCSQGRFFDYENFGMINLLHEFIDNGDIILFCVDSRDSKAWFSPHKNEHMGSWHRKYELSIIDEVIPFICKEYNISERFLTTGNSWGAYHALNFLLKFPRVFDVSISLSGTYRLNQVIGDYQDENVYFNDPLMYLPNLNDVPTIKSLQEDYIIICHGLGNWEHSNDEAAEISKLLQQKNIPYWYDVWGPDMPHDWPAWKKQIVYFLNTLKSGVLFSDGVKKLIGKERRVLRLELTEN